MERRQACWQCNNYYHSEELIPYKKGWVCGACKPRFFQKIQEGLEPFSKQHGETANFGMRFLAKLIDTFITTVMTWAIAVLGLLVLGLVIPDKFGGDGSEEVLNLLSLLIGYGLNIGIPCVYDTVLVGRYGASLGKLALGLRVIRSGGEKLTYWRAFGRYWGSVLSSLICLIGYLIAAFDEECRTLHDRLVDTRVIRV